MNGFLTHCNFRYDTYLGVVGCELRRISDDLKECRDFFIFNGLHQGKKSTIQDVHQLKDENITQYLGITTIE